MAIIIETEVMFDDTVLKSYKQYMWSSGKVLDEKCEMRHVPSSIGAEGWRPWVHGEHNHIIARVARGSSSPEVAAKVKRIMGHIDKEFPAF